MRYTPDSYLENKTMHFHINPVYHTVAARLSFDVVDQAYCVKVGERTPLVPAA